MITGFFDGVHYLLAGFNLIAKPGLRRFVILPVVINIVVFILLFMVLRFYIGGLDEWLVAHLPTWLRWMSIFLWLLFFVGFFLIFIAAFATLGAIIAAPFNSLLAEQVEAYLTGKPCVERSWWENIKDMPRMLGRQFTILFYYLPRALLILLLFLIPLVHAIVIIIWVAFCAWFLAMQYLDFPMDNHRIPVPEMREWLLARRAVAMGFGMSIMLVMSIPGVNLLAIPAAAAGAAKFWVEERAPSR
jgi:CysZ protein